MVIRWRFVSDETQLAIAGLLWKWQKVLPSWVKIVEVHEAGGTPLDQPDLLLSCTPHRQLRTLVLYVYPAWHAEEPSERENAVVHEYVHALVAPIHDGWRTTIEMLTEDEERWQKFMLAHMEELVEMAVEDVTNVLCPIRERPPIEEVREMAGGDGVLRSEAGPR